MKTKPRPYIFKGLAFPSLLILASPLFFQKTRVKTLNTCDYLTFLYILLPFQSSFFSINYIRDLFRLFAHSYVSNPTFSRILRQYNHKHYRCCWELATVYPSTRLCPGRSKASCADEPIPKFKCRVWRISVANTSRFWPDSWEVC